MALPSMTPAQLLAGAREVAERFPDAVLLRNQVGNLSVIDGGRWGAWLNLRTGELDVLSPEDAGEFS